MKKVIFLMVASVISMVFYADVYAKDKGQPDDIQTQYIERQRTLNDDLIQMGKDQAICDIHIEMVQQLELIDAKMGRSSLDTRIKRKEVDLEQSRINSSTQELRKNRDDLKLDALKYYKGKMPTWLKSEWDKEQKKFEIKYGKQVDNRTKWVAEHSPSSSDK
jgi:hypothetical protein